MNTANSNSAVCPLESAREPGVTGQEQVQFLGQAEIRRGVNIPNSMRSGEVQENF